MVGATAWPLEREYETYPAACLTEDSPPRVTRRAIRDALAAGTWRDPYDTQHTRWGGEDTLNWGDVRVWVVNKWLEQCLLEQSSECVYTDCLKQSTELQELLSSTQPPRLDEMYSFRDATSVHNYLQIHPNLIGRLTEAHSQLQKYFGPERTIVLQVVKDPEAEDSQQLFAFVRASISVEDALAQLDRFDEEWFLDHLEEFGGNFNVEVEFV